MVRWEDTSPVELVNTFMRGVVYTDVTVSGFRRTFITTLPVVCLNSEWVVDRIKVPDPPSTVVESLC